MFTRTIAASILALGVFAPVIASAQAASPSIICDNKDQADYQDCNYNGSRSESQGFSAQTYKSTVQEYGADRRLDEKNDNSGSN